MNWDIVLKIVIASIVSAGGIGGIIVASIKFSSGVIADRLSKKYETKLEKELELYKTQLGKREYVSKTRFDTEFSIYRELSRTFFDYVKAVCVMIPPGLAMIPADHDQRLKMDAEHYTAAQASLVAAQDSLHQNAPFIQKQFFDQYNSLLKDGNMQMFAYTKRFDKLYIASPEEKEKYDFDDYQRSKKMMQTLEALSDEIREYLAQLDVSN